MSQISHQRAQEIISRFSQLRILVIGDLMIDNYVWGRVNRISPEAPIPIVEVVREESKPGGAANVGLNLLALGAKVDFAGVVGKDNHATTLRQDLAGRGAGVTAIVDTASRPTTTKTRVLAQHQQMLRIDRESAAPLEQETLEALLKLSLPLIENVNGLVFSDYNKGVLQADLVAKLTAAAQGRVITVDPKPQNIRLFRHASLITPNKKEAEAAVGYPLNSEQAIQGAAEQLCAELSLGATLITRGEEGMSLYDRSQHVSIPTQAKQVFDVTGAGDTVISVATLALCAGATHAEAAILSNIAAGITVAHLGVYTVSAAELLAAV